MDCILDIKYLIFIMFNLWSELVVSPYPFWVSELAYLYTYRHNRYSMSSKSLMIELEAECDRVWSHVVSVQISLNMPGLHSSELIAFQIMTSVQ